jgi:hypothetical protein
MEKSLQIFQKWRDYYEGSNQSEFIDNLNETEKIIDDFAIGFFEWCVSQEALDLINDLVIVGEINKATTSKELLEIYKTTL